MRLTILIRSVVAVVTTLHFLFCPCFDSIGQEPATLHGDSLIQDDLFEVDNWRNSEAIDIDSAVAPLATQGDEESLDGEVVKIALSQSDKPIVLFGDWLGYNPTQHDTTWLAGTGDNLGIVSMESFPTLEIGKDSSLMIGTAIHFLNGPIATDMPPRLFDFQLAYQARKSYSEWLVLDTKISVGAYSDFEGSARKGVRFPGHAVGYYQWHPWLVSVLGIEFLDRDDVSLLPVFGWVWRPREDLVAELVFPRPKVQIRTGEQSAIYLSGELGGGTWAIERSSDVNDNATYRDLRLMVGMMDFGSDDRESALEIGWAFSRALEYRSSIGNYHPDDAFILRFRRHY